MVVPDNGSSRWSWGTYVDPVPEPTEKPLSTWGEGIMAAVRGDAGKMRQLLQGAMDDVFQ